MELYLIGIDDTDNLESRGTGFLARWMGESIANSGLGVCGGITRHQLLFDPRVPYTSHNSSACLEVLSSEPEKLWQFMVDFLVKNCAVGSDCGLCMIEKNRISDAIKLWGQTVKTELVNKQMAYSIANTGNVNLIGLTGTHDGVIGAMAGVGLRVSGNDGRFVSLKGQDIRTISGINTLLNLKEMVEIDRAITTDGQMVNETSTVNLDGWLRPVLKDGLITIVLNKTNNDERFQYELADKEYIKSISN